MSEENRTIEELQERIQNLELSLKYTKKDLEEANHEKHKMLMESLEEAKKNREVRDALRKEKNTSKFFSVAACSLFLFICIFVGIISAYGSDPDVFRKAIYNTSFWTVLKMMLSCIGSIAFDSIGLLLYCFICTVPLCMMLNRAIEEHPYAVFLAIAFLSGIYLAIVTIKNVFW